jgi:hypothetical protein
MSESFNFSASMDIRAEEGEANKLPQFSGNAYTGAVMSPDGWYGPIICDLDGIIVSEQHRPVLRQHDHEQIVGHTNEVKVTPEGVMIAGVFSGEKQHADKVVIPAKNGFKWKLSIGAKPVQHEHLEPGEEAEVNGVTVTGPLTISRKTELGEISFVPVGADEKTSATVTASKKKGNAMNCKAMLTASGKYSAEDVEKMNEDEAKAALKECMDDKGDKKEEPKAKAKASEDGDEDDTEKKAEAASSKMIKAARKELAQEEERVSAIRAAAKKYDVDQIEIGGKSVSFVAHAIKSGWTSDKATLEAMQASRPGSGVGSPHFYSPSAPEVNDAVLECAVLQAGRHDFRLLDDDFYFDNENGRSIRRVNARTQRETQNELKARYTDKVQQAAHTLFKGRVGLQQVLTAAARSNGYRGSEVIRDDGDIERVLRASNWSMDNSGFRADGASTASLANVLANVQNKFLLQGYLFVEQAWREISGVTSVKDFKATKNINLFGDFTFDKVGDSGELKNASLRDQAFSNQADQYGKILTIGRKTMINDDIVALTRVPMNLGRGSALKLNNVFWTEWLDTTNVDDGGSTAFWAATHTIANQSANSNYISGSTSALSSSSLATAKTTFDKQVDPAGNPLGIEAEILLLPPELDATAWELMNSQFIVMGGLASTSSASKQPSENRWKGRYKPVMSRYLSNTAYTGYSTTAWYLLANPGIIPTIECVFLNGVDAPVIQQAGPDYQFNNLGISMRGVFDFGVNMQNFRGGIKSAGA